MQHNTSSRVSAYKLGNLPFHSSEGVQHSKPLRCNTGKKQKRKWWITFLSHVGQSFIPTGSEIIMACLLFNGNPLLFIKKQLCCKKPKQVANDFDSCICCILIRFPGWFSYYLSFYTLTDTKSSLHVWLCPAYNLQRSFSFQTKDR